MSDDFFDRDAQLVAKDLLGKVIRSCYEGVWLSATLIETEAYYLEDKASHASLGYTDKRAALFMPPGTIYMYYARGKDSLNVSCQGPGNAVLIKAGVPYMNQDNVDAMIAIMQQLNPISSDGRIRPVNRLCSGQTLLCRALNIKVMDWDKKQFDPERLYIEDVGNRPETIIQTTRLGIPQGRDEALLYRFIDARYVNACTQKPKGAQISL